MKNISFFLNLHSVNLLPLLDDLTNPPVILAFALTFIVFAVYFIMTKSKATL